MDVLLAKINKYQLTFGSCSPTTDKPILYAGIQNPFKRELKFHAFTNNHANIVEYINTNTSSHIWTDPWMMF